MSRASRKAKRETALNKVLTEHVQQGRELQEIAGETGYSRRQLSRMKAEHMTEIIKTTELTQAELKAKHRQRIQNLTDEVERHRKAGEALPLACIAEMRALLALEMKYDEPVLSIAAHVSGPQLDALYLDIREVLLDADEETRQEVLDHARELVKSRRKAIVVDLNLFPKELTDGNV